MINDYNIYKMTINYILISPDKYSDQYKFAKLTQIEV